MSRFDKLDERASAAMDRVFADPVTWRPMAHRKGGRYTQSKPNDTRYPDPDRPVRGLDQSADPFVATVVWKPMTIDPSTNDNEQGGLPVCDVMLDFDRRLFMGLDGIERLPEIGDLFDMKVEGGAIVTVQNPREPVDDGTNRIQIWANAPE